MNKKPVLEDVSQADLFDRLDEWNKTGLFFGFIRWIFAIPNGGGRSKAQATLLKKTGVTAGVADICAPFPVRGRGGALYVEMKRTGLGRQHQEQKDFEAFCKRVGNVYVLCDTPADAEYEIMNWLCMFMKQYTPDFDLKAVRVDEYWFGEEGKGGIISRIPLSLPEDILLRKLHNVALERTEVAIRKSEWQK